MPSFRVRRVPSLEYCRIHGAVGIWAEDGTPRWHCAECIDDSLYRADFLLTLPRRMHVVFHVPYGIRRASCLYCNPGAIA